MQWLGPSWIEINLDHVIHNVRQISNSTKAKLCAVIKGDAYGHGAVVLGHILSQAKEVTMLAVSDLPEAKELHTIGVNHTPILLLGPALPPQIREIVKLNLTVTVSNDSILPYLAREATAHKQNIKLHIKIDTGMGRIGVWPESALQLAQKIVGYSCFTLEGVYTHFSSAFHDLKYTRIQLQRLLRVKQEFEQHGFINILWHSANSSAFLKLPESHGDLVRVGTLLYGQSAVSLSTNLQLKDTWKLYSHLIQVKSVPKGTCIGYGRTYTTKRPSIIGVLPLGYGDGLGIAPSRESHWQHVRNSLIDLLDSSHKVMVDGTDYPIIGKIAMGMCCIDLTEHPNANNLTGHKVEIPTRRVTISRRIPKLYMRNQQPILVYWNNKFFRPIFQDSQLFVMEVSSWEANKILAYGGRP